jgi:hypothetical protein
MHLHFEEIHQHLLDEKPLMPLDQQLDIQLLILLQHQNPTGRKITINHRKFKLTNGTSFIVYTMTPLYFGVFSVMRPKPDLTTLCPYRNCCSAFGLSQILNFAYGAIKSSAVICKRNLRVLVKRPKQVPKLSNSFRGKLLANFIIVSLEKKKHRDEYSFVLIKIEPAIINTFTM